MLILNTLGLISVFMLLYMLLVYIAFKSTFDFLKFKESTKRKYIMASTILVLLSVAVYTGAIEIYIP